MTDAQWFYGRDGSQGGPVGEDALREMLFSGQLRGTDVVWREGMPAWEPVARVPAFANAAAASPGPALRPPPLPARAPVFPGHYAQPPSVPYASAHGYPPLPVEDIGQNAGMRMLLPVGRSGWAIASGYLGLLSLIPILGVLLGFAAVVTGVLAVSDMKKNPQRHGMGRAVFGIIVGALGVLFSVLVIVGLASDR